MDTLLTVRWGTKLLVTALVLLALLVAQPIRAASPVIENSGSLKLGGLPSGESSSGLFALIASPDTPSPLIAEESTVPLSASEGYLVCRGATLAGTSDAERVAMGTCALVAGAVVVDGITMGDLQAGLADSRHGRTLTALFRARMMLTEDPVPKQTLILVVHGSDDAVDKDTIVSDTKSLFDAVAAEQSHSTSFEDRYDVFLESAEDPNKVGVFFLWRKVLFRTQMCASIVCRDPPLTRHPTRFWLTGPFVSGNSVQKQRSCQYVLRFCRIL